ncbi:MAG: ATPase [Crocinitomicaceae bacterium]|jgi:DNA replication protein DnaC
MKPIYTIENNIRLYDFKACLEYIQANGKQKYGAHFNIQKEDYTLIRKMICYAIRDEEACQKYQIDMNKGILLLGPVGSGKTSLMNLIRDFFPTSFRPIIKSTREISYEFNQEGYATIDKYGKTEKVFCFDDLGVESSLKHYGNECNTMGEIILSRYDQYIQSGMITHVTTNLNSVELEKMYGVRVRSRLREMFNLIAFPKETQDKRR